MRLGSLPSVLYEAGAEDADMLIAVTDTDEVNMTTLCKLPIPCLFRTQKKIDRVRNLSYLAYSGLFGNNAVAVDFPICPEQLVTHNIQNLISQADAHQVLDFWWFSQTCCGSST